MARCNHVLNIQPSPCTFFCPKHPPIQEGSKLHWTARAYRSIRRIFAQRPCLSPQYYCAMELFFFFLLAEAIKAQKSPIHQPPLVPPPPFIPQCIFLSYCPFFFASSFNQLSPEPSLLLAQIQACRYCIIHCRCGRGAEINHCASNAEL